jgi:hypothetical protein
MLLWSKSGKAPLPFELTLSLKKGSVAVLIGPNQ